MFLRLLAIDQLVSLENETLECLSLFLIDAKVTLEGQDLGQVIERDCVLNLALLVLLLAVYHRLVLSVVHEELSHCYLFLDVVLPHALHVLVNVQLVRLTRAVLLTQHLLQLVRIKHLWIGPVEVVHDDVVAEDALDVHWMNWNVELIVQAQQLRIADLILLYCLYLV